MTALVIAGGLLLLAIAAIAIAWPLLRRQEEAPGREIEPMPAEDPLTELLARRDSIYQAIKELEFDYEVGKVSEPDYQAFDAQLKGQAVGVLQEIDALGAAEADPELDARLEAEIAALRRNGYTPVPEPSPFSPQTAAFCPQCGSKTSTSDRFCGKCGTALA